MPYCPILLNERHKAYYLKNRRGLSRLGVMDVVIGLNSGFKEESWKWWLEPVTLTLGRQLTYIARRKKGEKGGREYGREEGEGGREERDRRKGRKKEKGEKEEEGREGRGER